MITRLSEDTCYTLLQEYFKNKYFARLYPALKWASENFEDELSPAEVWKEAMCELPVMISQPQPHNMCESYIHSLKRRYSEFQKAGEPVYTRSDEQKSLTAFLVVFCVVYRLFPLVNEYEECVTTYYNQIRRHVLYNYFKNSISMEEDRQIKYGHEMREEDYPLTDDEKLVSGGTSYDGVGVLPCDEPDPQLVVDNNIWFKTCDDCHKIDVVKIRRHINEKFAKKRNKVYEWYAVYFFCRHIELASGIETLVSFCEQMNKPGWFPDQGCAFDSFKYYAFLQPGTSWSKSESQSKNKNVTQRAITRIKQVFDNLCDGDVKVQTFYMEDEKFHL